MNPLAHEIRKRRLDAHMRNREQLAARIRALGVRCTGSAVGNWEGGHSFPGRDQLVALQRVLGIDTDTIWAACEAHFDARPRQPEVITPSSNGHSGWSVRPLADLGERRALCQLVALCDSPLVTSTRRVGTCSFGG